jgi:hypothetical protein
MRAEISKLVGVWEKRFAQPLTQWGIRITRWERHDEKADCYCWELYPTPRGKGNNSYHPLLIAKVKPDKIFIVNLMGYNDLQETEVASIWSAFFQRAREVASEALLRKLAKTLLPHNIIPNIPNREITFLSSGGYIARLSFIFSGYNRFILKDERGTAVKIEPKDFEDLARQVLRVCALLLL